MTTHETNLDSPFNLLQKNPDVAIDQNICVFDSNLSNQLNFEKGQTVIKILSSKFEFKGSSLYLEYYVSSQNEKLEIIGFMSNFSVPVHLRRLGIGTALINQALEMTKKGSEYFECDKITLFMVSTNDSHTLLHRLGFTHWNIERYRLKQLTTAHSIKSPKISDMHLKNLELSLAFKTLVGYFSEDEGDKIMVLELELKH